MKKIQKTDNIDKLIISNSESICQNIEKNKDDPSLLCQNILNCLRNFVESIFLKIYANENIDEKIDVKYKDYKTIKMAVGFIAKTSKYRYFYNFHNSLQRTVSHWTADKNSAERLMIKYIDYLRMLKIFLNNEYSMSILENLTLFHETYDNSTEKYYKCVLNKLNEEHKIMTANFNTETCYVWNIKKVILKNDYFFEVTLIPATNESSKSHKTIFFTKLNLSKNYSIEITYYEKNIDLFNIKTSIKLIYTWCIKIRPVEISKFCQIFNEERKFNNKLKEYKKIMYFLSNSNLNLVDVSNLEEYEFENWLKEIDYQSDKDIFLSVLIKARKLIKCNLSGSNIIRYFLYKLNNEIIKSQMDKEVNEKLSNLKLRYGCIPFDEMPFATSLIDHNPNMNDLYKCFDTTNREHEILAKSIITNAQNNRIIYNPIDEIKYDEKRISNLVEIYNKKLYRKHHENRKIMIFKKYLYINQYEFSTKTIIDKLSKMSHDKGIEEYSNSIKFWIGEKDNLLKIDSDEKKEILINLYSNSSVALLYGPAGTGKTTFINYLTNFFKKENKLCLAVTNSALENLKNKTNSSNSDFKTIEKICRGWEEDKVCDILIIDECGILNNDDILIILKKINFKLLFLVGDDHQIESIKFGNWFNFCKKLLNPNVIFELKENFRCNNNELLDLFLKTRENKDDLYDYLSISNFSFSFSNVNLKYKNLNDEIILCLQYGGLYGINNINSILQDINQGKEINFKMQKYKVGDPILFNDSNIFSPSISNNEKGIIVDIQEYENKITFQIELNRKINDFNLPNAKLKLIKNNDINKSIVEFDVFKGKNDEDDVDEQYLIHAIPFQISYAVSIHKAQGLEYNSVKLIINDDISDEINLNIFYTAITRAKNELKIYWTPQTMKSIISKFEKQNIQKDLYIFANKFKYQIC